MANNKKPMANTLAPTKEQTAYQSNIAKPVEPQKWYKGNQPTQNEILGRIGTIRQSDPTLADQIYSGFNADRSNPSSPYYQPYRTATNRALASLSQMGVDTTRIDDDWFEKHRSTQSDLIFNGTTNTPSSPGTKATAEQNKAYQIWQVGKSEETTKKAEKEWAALQEEASYWATRQDRNYSDEEIVAKIYGPDFARKYPTLAAMDESMKPGGTLLELNRGIDYSRDNLYGVIWAARNDGGTGNIDADITLSMDGQGNGWRDNPEITAKLDKSNLETFDPYSVGSTLEEEGLYFGVSTFAPDWAEKMRDQIDWNDETAVKMYQSVASAEETTRSAESELEELNAQIDEWINAGLSEEKILEKIDEAFDKCPTLKKMGQSLISTKLLPTTRSIPGSRIQDIKQRAKVNAQRQQGSATAVQETVAEAQADADELIRTASSQKDEEPPQEEAKEEPQEEQPQEEQQETAEAEAEEQEEPESKNEKVASSESFGTEVQRGQKSEQALSDEASVPEEAQAVPETKAEDIGNAGKDSSQLHAEQNRKNISEWADAAEQLITPSEKTAMSVCTPDTEQAIEQLNEISQTISDTKNVTAGMIRESNARKLRTRVIKEYPDAAMAIYEHDKIVQENAKYEEELHETNLQLRRFEAKSNLTLVDPETRFKFNQLEESGEADQIRGMVDAARSTDNSKIASSYYGRVMTALWDRLRPDGEKDFMTLWSEGKYTSIDDFVADHPEANQYLEWLDEGMPDESSDRAMDLEDSEEYETWVRNKASLEKKISENEEKLARNAEAYEAAQQTRRELQDQSRMLYGTTEQDQKYGMTLSDAVDIALPFSQEFVPFNYSGTTEWDEIMEIATATGQPADEIISTAEKKLQDATEKLNAIQYVLDNREQGLVPVLGVGKKLGFKFDEQEEKKLEQAKKVYEIEVANGNYFLYSCQPDFEEKAQAALERGITEDMDPVTKLIFSFVENALIKKTNIDIPEAIEKTQKTGQESLASITGAHHNLTHDNIEGTESGYADKETEEYEGAEGNRHRTSRRFSAIKASKGKLDSFLTSAADKLTDPVLFDFYGYFFDDPAGIGPLSLIGGPVQGIIDDARIADCAIAMTQVEAYTYLALLMDSEEEANKYFRHIANEQYGTLQNRAAEQEKRTLADIGYGKKGDTARAIGVITTFLTQQISNVDSTIHSWLLNPEARAINPNSTRFAANTITQNIRSGVTESVIDAMPGEQGKNAADVINAGFSAVDSMVNYMITRGMGKLVSFAANKLPILGEALGWLQKAQEGEYGKFIKMAADAGNAFTHSTLMGAGAAATNWLENVGRGVDPQKAREYSYIVFLSETLTEMISFDNMAKIENATGFVQAIKQLIANGLEELVGESLNEAWQVYAEPAMLGEMAGHNQEVERLVNEGYNRYVAEQIVNKDENSRIIRAGLSGMFSSIAQGGITYARADIQQQYNRQQFNTAMEQTLNILSGRNMYTASSQSFTKIAAALMGNTRMDMKESAAAGMSLINNLCEGRAQEALGVVRNILGQATEENFSQLKEALAYAAMTEGEGRSVLKDIVEGIRNGGQVTQYSIGHLLEAVNNDMHGENADQHVGQIKSEIHKSRVAIEEMKIMAADASALQNTKAAYQKAMENLRDAEAKREEAIRVRNAKAEALLAAKEEMIQNPNNENRHALKEATNELNSASIMYQQAQDHVEKMQWEENEASKAANEAIQNALLDVRTRAEETVAQQEAEEQEAAERTRQEIEAAQLEEDMKRGIIWRNKRDAMIEEMLDREHLEGEEREARRQEYVDQADRVKEGRIDMTGLMNNTEGMLAIHAFSSKLGMEFELTDDLPESARGKYQNGKIYLNNNLIRNGKMTIGQALVEAALHEVTHAMENLKGYSAYRNAVLKSLFMEDGQFDQAAYNGAIAHKIAEYKEAGINLTRQQAEHEVVADFARTKLNDKDVVQRFIDDGLGAKMRNILHNINQAIKNYRLKGEDRAAAEYLRKAERAFQRGLDELARTSVHPEGNQFSVKQFAQSAKLFYNDDVIDNVEAGLYTEDPWIRDEEGTIIGRNEKAQKVTKVTPDMIKNTPVGLLIDIAENGNVTKKGNVTLAPTISHETAQAQRQMFADLMTMITEYNDSNLVWEIASSTLFSAMKSNSDPQYSTTVDFGTVCAKTQEIINVMSRVMLNEKRGLTRQEVLDVYNQTSKAGLTVPCPVCYVFSRWMGVPSLLGQMSQFQKDFVRTNEDGSINRYETEYVADEYIQNALKKYGGKKEIDKAKTSIQNKIKTQEKNRTDALAVITSQTATETEKAKAQEKHDAAIVAMDNLTKDLKEIEAYNWITQALLDKNGNLDKDFQLTPDEVLFDLRKTGEFAKYTKNWTYRNTRGAGMGKAIMPYSGETIGDIIYGTERKADLQNPFLTQLPGKARQGIKDAIARARQQNLIGGQRLQSTSDFRPEWGLDYMMAFLELQAVGSKVQMYTKVAEAVDLLASMGGDINLSIMGSGNGYHIATEQEIELAKQDTAEGRDIASRMGEIDGVKYVLDFSDVTGMNYDVAKGLKNAYSNVQAILVGMNDIHIRLAMANPDIDFIIPWHSSGNSKSVLASLISSVGEHLETSSDYTDTQSDSFEYQTEDQKRLWELRMKILKGDKLTEDDHKEIFKDTYLQSLYERFKVEGKDSDCYNVKLRDNQAKQIFPYEYWNKSLTKDRANENGRLFIEYCQHFGVTPRFSGVVTKNKDGVVTGITGNFAGAVYDSQGNITGYDTSKMADGYWKVLIDRSMYDLEGKYRDQQVVDVTKAKIGHLENGKLVDSDMPLATSAMYGPNYSEQEKNAVDNSLAVIHEKMELREAMRQEALAKAGGQMSVNGDMTIADMEQAIGEMDNEYMDAVDRGDMETAQRMVNERAEALKAEVFAATDVPTYRIRRGPKPKNTIKVYKTFTLDENGRPSALFVSSKNAIPVGVWLDAQDTFHFRSTKNGRMYVPSTKNPNTKGGATGTPINLADIESNDLVELERLGHIKKNENGEWSAKTLTSLAYRPGWHAGDMPFFPQGGMQIEGSNYDNVHRYNQVVFECEMDADKDYTTYDIREDGTVSYHDRQEMPVDGSYKFATNPMANAQDIGAWYISGALKINRALTEEECNRILEENGRMPQEWQQYQSASELKSIKGKENKYAYEHTIGPLDLDALGYDPSQTDGGKKLLDAVTYDDDGNVIPLSQRFDKTKNDPRYSVHGEETRADAEQRMNRALMEAGVVTREDVEAYNNQASERHGRANGMINGSVDYTVRNGHIQFDNAPSDAIIKNLETIGMVYNPGGRFWSDNGRHISMETIEQAVDDGNRGIRTTRRNNPTRTSTPTANQGTAAQTTQPTVDNIALPLEGNNPGAIQSGPGPQRQFGRQTAQRSDELDAAARQFVLNNSTRDVDTNIAQVNRAIDWIRSNRSGPGSNGMVESVQKIMDPSFDYRSADGQARMLSVLGMAVATNDLGTQVMLADAFNRQGTDLGRALQARKIFRLMTPEGRISTMMKMLQNAQEELDARGNNTKLKFSDWILRAASVATEEGDFQAVQEAAAEELAEQIPARWRDKLVGWRMLSMLGNPRTHIRNVLGNFFFMPAVGIKNKIAATMELGLDKSQRTKTLGFASPEARAFAKEYANTIRDTLTGDAKYKDGDLVQQAQKIWGTGDGIISKTLGRALQGASDFNSWALEAEDWIFLRRHFKNALAGYMTARGLTAENMTGQTLEDATVYAVQEAKKATYRDANKTADALNRISRNGGVLGFLTDAVLPFKRTPANILKRGMEYSAVGFMRSLTSDLYHMKQWFDHENGKLDVLPEKAISPSQWIDRMASGLTGLGVMALGAVLSGMGVIRAGFGDDDDDEYDKIRGHQEYSLVLPTASIFGHDVSMTIDWAAPMSMPLFVGATTYNAIKDMAEGEDIDIGALVDSILNITEPVFNLSMLDGVNSLLDVNSYGEGNAITKILTKVGTNYVSSYWPTLFGQAARTIDPIRRKSFVESGASMQTIRYAIEQLENKIPFLSKTNIPYRDVWGRTTEEDHVSAALENFFSPAYINPITSDPVTDEIQRLYQVNGDKARDKSIKPKYPSKTMSIAGENVPLTAQQYDRLTVERNKTAHTLLGELIETPEYVAADDDTRIEMIADIWTYCSQHGNGVVSGGTTKKDVWVADAEQQGNPVQAVIDRAVKRNKDAQIDSDNISLRTALTRYDLESAQAMIASLRRDGVDDKTIKGTVTKHLKPIYQQAYRDRDTATMYDIERMLELMDPDMTWKYSDWLKGIEEEEEDT